MADGYARPGPPDDSAIVRTARALTDLDVFLPPERVFSYSNPGFVLAGALIEAASGRSFARAVEERLLAPLGMRRSTFDPAAATDPRAKGHDGSGPGRPKAVSADRSHPAGWTTGGLHTSVLELARFTIAFLDGGRFEGRQVIPEAVVWAMSRTHSWPRFPVYRVNNFTFRNHAYGYGSILYDVRGVSVVGHNGDVEGFASLLRMTPAHRAAVIVLSNQGGTWLNRTAEAAMETVMPLGPSTPAASPGTTTTSRSNLEAWAGVYQAPNRAPVELSIERGRLMMKQGDRVVEVTGLDGPELVLLRDSAGARYVHMQARALRRDSVPIGPPPM